MGRVEVTNLAKSLGKKSLQEQIAEEVRFLDEIEENANEEYPEAWNKETCNLQTSVNHQTV